MQFVDRLSRYPNRYLMTDEDNNESYVFLERADEPQREGTPLNAGTFNSLFWLSESEDYPGCYYHDVNGVEEWLNPPMAPGVEYRTVKRYMGNPVYTCAYYFEKLASQGNEVSARINGSISRIITTTAAFSSDTGAGLSMSEAYVSLSFTNTSKEICIRTFTEQAEKYDALVILEYTLA